MTLKKYSVIGLGKLGASMVAGIASRGFEVIGVDVVPRAVELVQTGQAPVQETNLTEVLTAHRARIQATLDCREAVLKSDVTFVVVPTPSDAHGAFSLKHAAAALREIGRALAEKPDYHLVVLTCTVLPGSTRYGLLPILEQESGKTCGPDFGLCYSPEFIALGSVIHDFLNPDFLLIGEFDSRSGERLQQAYAEIVENQAPCQRMSIENAELAELSTQHVCDNQDYVCEHAGRFVRAGAGRGYRRGHKRYRIGCAHWTQISYRGNRVRRSMLSTRQCGLKLHRSTTGNTRSFG